MMRHTVRPALLLLGLLLPALALAADRPQVIAYGNDHAQQLDFYAAEPGSALAPLVVFIHGGAWQGGDKATATGDKAAYFHALGYAFAAINYRLLPEVGVEQEATDVATALAFLRAKAPSLGVDPGRIALVGHSAGAHLAALVATDPVYLGTANVPLTAIRAVSLLDGAAYDIPRQIDMAGTLMRRLYRKAFGDDPQRQNRLSPTAHAAAPNARAFLLHCAVRREDACIQAMGLAQALVAAGTPAHVIPVEGANHRDLNRKIGTPGDAPSADIADFLDENL
ncbi:MULTISPECIES: alpha/beta hydrolase [Alphaproteobacteria]|uniref:BD-FAE-like domain-containing protein n=2 Tax=Alphaproteobacteria TaxID=28211 RepID=A0A512HFI0_9HYPH|nr:MULTISPECIES: alpha/beta hydrolase [Alphaproteobacteria]GEO84213.1 hypothetical protein RNA01_11450 [Ciceribacter naphthalenivorans]GLR24749.1 hypothetical protein GCM10007920_45430 [Ciceribacter naphthalenivorans]GLT07605.1 hypothetical protein GCM10007926_45430 [Sphingomonas psychrolutea]